MDTPFHLLPPGAITPRGWLNDRLRLMADTITGKLDEIWPDVGADNGWLGGSGDAWERPVYWLDGLLPLAYILRDEALKAKAVRFIEWMLSSQDAEGQFGPAANDDMWPRMVALKGLINYHSATGDSRVPPFLLKYFQYVYKVLDKKPLRDWGRARGGELQLCAFVTYQMTGKKFLLDVIEKIGKHTLDWTGMLSVFPYNRMDMTIEQLKQGWTGTDTEGRKLDDDTRDYWMRQYLFTHVVNMAMGLKQPAVDAAVKGGLKQSAAFRAGWERLMRHHGVANGMFTGDEHLAGPSPSRGTETCAVVEAMYSMECLLWLTGDAMCGDILEKLAFNALPAALSEDGWLHQYDQQANQVLITKAKRDWHSNGDDANLFGIEPNFGCCTANLHQGFPKYAQSLWMSSDDGLCAQSYAPCRVTWRVNGAPVRIEVDTLYPMDGLITMKISLKKPQGFTLRLRIPEWARDASVRVNDEGYMEAKTGAYSVITRTFKDGDIITLDLPMNPSLTEWYRQSVSVERGPLVFALPVDTTWIRLGDGDLANREARPTSAWNWALLLDKGLEYEGANDETFDSNCAARICVHAAPLPEWGLAHNSAAPPPVSPLVSGDGIERIALKPYAFCPLRITQFPKGRL